MGAHAVSSTDAAPASGCPSCRPGRDALTGWGRLDVAAALARAETGGVAAPDTLEPNDGAGSGAWTLWGRAARTLHPTLDFWDDPSDVYRVRADAGTRLAATLAGPAGARLALWRPGTEQIAAATRRTPFAWRSPPRPRPSSGSRTAFPAGGAAGTTSRRQARPGAGPYALSSARADRGGGRGH